MNARTWFRALMTPGVYLKRWLILCILGSAMVLWSIHRMRDEMAKYQIKFNLQLLLIAFGLAFVLFGLYKLISSALKYSGFTRQAFLDNLVDRQFLSRGPKIVVIGGGTGLATILSGLKQYSSNLTACVTVTDDGGSSGRLRDAFGILAPGDIRNCIVALSTAPALLSDLFSYRFQEGEGLKGHTLGNLFIAALTRITGSFERAVEESCRVLSTRGRVYPLTRSNIRLVAELSDGREVLGEALIGKANLPIRRLAIDPPDFHVTPEVISAILEANLVIVGPGSLYTSIIPNLLPAECRRAMMKTPAPVVYICNIMTQSSETLDFSAADHVRAIYNHTSNGTIGLFDWIVVNTQPPPDDYIQKYSQEGAKPVRVDIDAIHKLGLRVLDGDFLKGDVPVETAEGPKHVLRHDADKLAQRLVSLSR